MARTAIADLGFLAAIVCEGNINLLYYTRIGFYAKECRVQKPAAQAAKRQTDSSLAALAFAYPKPP